MTLPKTENNSEKLNAEFWSNRYLSGNTGWDMGKVSPPIKEYSDQLKDMNARILIPGCGNAYEAEYLSNKGFKYITLLDISEVLIKSLSNKFSGNENVTLLTQDFFDHSGKYDLIIEQTFFCSLDPEMRTAYVLKMSELLNPGGKIAGVLFNREFDKEGPPFGGTEDEYKKLFSGHFEIRVLENCYNSAVPRNGSEVFINLMRKK
ncbi:MAG: methyltransferase [Bacteroidetes bacterium]|nr:methyltransferase [Bacteroidota bacterium]